MLINNKKRIVMLHKQPSNKNNQWKYALLLPILTVFIFAFNTKTIAQKKDSEWDVKISTIDFSILIDKNSTDATLKSETETFKKEFDVELNFKRVKRNSKNEITAIKIEVKSPNSSAKYSTSGSKAIKPILISFDTESNSVSIGNIEKNQNTYKYKMQKGENVYIITPSNTKDKNYHKHGNPLYIIDGKEYSKEKMEELDPNNIEKVEVLKGEKAIEKYGEKGKNGIILITTKK